MKKFLIESFARIDEQAHVTGIALIPRISRNNNAYTKGELKRFDNVTVPLNWEHDAAKKIGQVTFHYNPTLEQVYYDGYVTDEAYADLVRNKTLFTSIEAEPISTQVVCNGPDDCFNMPFGLVPEALALTETPGVPETSVNVIESLIKEAYHQGECPEGQHMVDGKCVPKENREDAVGDCIKKMMDHGKDHDQAVAICMNKEEKTKEAEQIGVIVRNLLTRELTEIENRIQDRYELLTTIEDAIQVIPTDVSLGDQQVMVKEELKHLMDRLLVLKKDFPAWDSISKVVPKIEKLNLKEDYRKQIRENIIKRTPVCAKCHGVRKH